MKRFYLAGIVVMAAICAQADYSTMVFKTTDGQTHSLSLTGLNIEFDATSMIVKNADTTLTLPLASLSTMEFSDGSTVVVENFIADFTNCEVFSSSGVAIGRFESIENAAASLPSGIYVLQYANGETTKIVVSK